MADSIPSLPVEAAQNMLDYLLSTFVQPDLARRVQAGRPLAPGTPVFAIQVVFNIERDPEVRLNEEVGGFMEARVTRAMTKGEVVMPADITEITRAELTDEDPDAAHITALLLADGWCISWDARYNASIIAAHVQAADEFVELAEYAVEKGRLRGFVENAFHAAELLAKAEILALPDAQLLNAKTHRTVAGRFNKWARLGNTELRFAQLRSELERLRAPARYLRGEFGLDETRAREMLATLKEMRTHAEEVAPRRSIAATKGSQ